MILLSQKIFQVKILLKSAVYDYNVLFFGERKKINTIISQIISILNPFGDKQVIMKITQLFLRVRYHWGYRHSNPNNSDHGNTNPRPLQPV